MRWVSCLLLGVQTTSVDVSERRNPVIFSRIVILSQRVPRLAACVRCRLWAKTSWKPFHNGDSSIYNQYASCSTVQGVHCVRCQKVMHSLWATMSNCIMQLLELNSANYIQQHFTSLLLIWTHHWCSNWGCPADLLTDQTVLDPKVHCHTWRAQQVGIEPTSPLTKVVALPTKPQIAYLMLIWSRQRRVYSLCRCLTKVWCLNTKPA